MVLKLGQVESAYVIGDYAKGKDSGIIDMVLIGEIDKSILLDLATKTEKIIKRKIRTVVLNKKEFKKLNKTLNIKHALLIWGKSRSEY